MIGRVSDFSVRVLDDSELRASSDVFRAALHIEPVNDEHWKYIVKEYEPGRTFGAFADGRLIGTTMSFGSSLALPGGAAPPLAAVSGVGVRADHTRRGVLTELMRAQLTAAAEARDVFAGLHASEGAIYGRFGYGIGTTARMITVQSKRAELRPEVPFGGEVRLLDADEAIEALPRIYERIRGARPGMMGRSAGWWSAAYERRLRTEDHFLVAVHSGPDGADGFVGYLPQKDDPNWMASEVTIRAVDLQGPPAAINDLWRYLLSIDLASKVTALVRPLDEPIDAMLVNQHVATTELYDDLWVRIIDVPAALAARGYADADPIVVEVRDRLLPANSGNYRVGPQGTERTTDPADLALGADVLAMLYLGTTRASLLAGIGRIEVRDPAALPRADRLFATDVTAWCGTLF
jgi:predicted acetyltransferase